MVQTASATSAAAQWAAKLRNPTLTVLPHDFVRPADGKVVESSIAEPIPESALLALSHFGIDAPFQAVVAAFAVLVFRLTGDEDVVIGSSTSPASDSSSLAYVFRTSITGTTPFSQILEAVSAEEAFARANPASIAEIIAETHSNSDTSDAILFRAGIHAGATSSPRLTDIVVNWDADSRSVEVRFNSLLFKRERISILAEQLVKILTEASTNPQQAVGGISLLTPRQTKVTPDPTTDLHWSQFGGAIHDIFADNAAKHPERPCVVETANIFTDAGAADRVFTYKHIDEASNVLAHHLVKSGIEIGDVVMVYAYRGVDLVVAVMGVLKAGATFSVIDPAYPPARQNVYLSVAKPRALLVLRKAGILAPLVEDYIRDELDLKTRVPALEILSDGSLIGGDADGSDILAPVQSLKSQRTGVVVGPDSTPTLSFTSGSEGIPKGVRGRHFSLTYYFPWMSRTFGLSENDKFTMLSGIAHDPIQRDIFTPLFLGARLLVPTSDDIGTPGRLAEWMGTHGASVTHLTPAMGQLLSAQATHEIPSLHHAFFVGDILTKRDCHRLQLLARNVAIVNMYGTTETQRSVSYFEVAPVSKDASFLQSQKDIMPAGKGMLDVQLLIVNRHDRTQTCAIGEVGEIYVRAGGLAEGYLQLPDMTAQKFVTNWFVPPTHWESADIDNGESWRKFWQGPRDRLYRTGDLGRYLPDGNTECSGRADDQVKIRGFRIELGEIDTHLSRHPHVRENITLVRRDKDEEPVLISYIVPHQTSDTAAFMSAHESLDDDEEDDKTTVVKSLIRYRRLIKDIKTYLRGKLASYAVPTVIVPLTQMPLNPNGKVDKPALPFPDTAQLAVVAKRSNHGNADSHTKLSEMEIKIRDLWLDILPQTPVSVEPTDSFFDLGGHSVLATRMIFEVRKKLLLDVPLGLIFKEPTIGGFARALEKLGSSGIMETEDDEGKEKKSASQDTLSYADDAEKLSQELPKYISRTEPLDKSEHITVFLTGATGFLGSFIIRDIFERQGLNARIYAHVRAADKEKGLERLKNSGLAYGTWKDGYEKHIVPVVGNLEEKHFGLPEAEWKELTDNVDVVIHNGALVHWVYPYSTLRAPNVVGTLNVMDMCTSGKPKFFSFVSSTSAIDTEYYVQLSDNLTEQGLQGLPESDSLEGSRSGLGNGYGQAKWAAEYIIRKAGKNHGLRGSIVRSGYIVGDTSTGVTNTDDFLVRMIKGCIQLGYIPNINNTVNMVPVDHVARLTVAASFHPPHEKDVSVVHVTGHPRLRFNEFLRYLAVYGYSVEEADYVPWRIALEKYVIEDSKDNALYPLLHFVLDNLPQSTKAPELDDTNAQISLKKDAAWTGVDLSGGAGLNVDLTGTYLKFLVEIGYLPSPGTGDKELPQLTVAQSVFDKMSSIGGRGKN